MRTCLWPFIVLIVAARLTVGAPGEALSVSQNGEAALSVVIPKNPAEAEEAAAKALAAYLGKITGATFDVVPEPFTGRNAIFVGATAQDLGEEMVEPSKTDDAFTIARVDNGVVLRGANPRSTVYAVWDFLERECGVRFFNLLGEESVPTDANLAVEVQTRSVQPTFKTRDWMTTGIVGRSLYPVEGMPELLSKFRINGPAVAAHLPIGPQQALWGGVNDELRLHIAHTLGITLAHPDVWFETEPEVFAEIDGERSRDAYCYASERLAEIVAAELEEKFRELGAGVYVLSPPDNWLACESEAEAAIAKQHGHRSASFIFFVNDVARRLGDNFPGLQLEMLAYAAQEDPPTGVQLDPAVRLRFCPISKFQWDALQAEVNRPWLEKLRGWSDVSSDLYIWDYPGIYGYSGGHLRYQVDGENRTEEKQIEIDQYDRLFPQPNLFAHAEDLTTYADAGVRGVFLETDAGMAEGYCEADVRFWLMSRLLWNPRQDSRELAKEFCDSFYGNAGPSALEYLELLDSAYAGESVRFATHIGNPLLQTYLSPAFLVKANGILDRGDALVAGDAALQLRLGRLRSSLDVATLFLLNQLAKQAPAEAEVLGPREVIEARLLATRLETVREFGSEGEVEAEKAAVEKLFAAARGVAEDWERPAP